MDDRSSTSSLSDAEPDLPETSGKALADDEPVSWKEKLMTFIQYHWKGVVCVIIPIILLPIILPLPAKKYQWCGYTLVLMAFFWVTECLPLPVTSFLPVIIFPLTGVMDTNTTCKCYIDDTVFMFLGSQMLAAAVEQSGLHKRLALNAIHIIGYSHYKLLFTMCLVTMFASMWITNTAATTMMIPINFALLKVFEDQGLLSIYESTITGELEASDLTTCYFCASTFSATIGGIGTLVGTATNLVFKGLFQSQYQTAPEYLSFPKFSAFTIPIMILLEITMYLFLIIKYFGFLRKNSKEAKAIMIPPEAMEAAKLSVDNDLATLGKISFWEIMVIILFGGSMLMFFSRSPQIFTGWGDVINHHFGINEDKFFVRDSVLAMLTSFLMMLLPSSMIIFKNFTAKYKKDLPKGKVKSILDWEETDRTMPYSFVFLLGGGFALSTAAKPEYSNLNSELGLVLAKLRPLPHLAILMIVMLITVAFTNFASNVATCHVIAPIAMAMAKELNQNPFIYNLATGLSASFCFCLPVGTPGNLIVQGAAKIPTKKMVIAGSVPSITTIIITWVGLVLWGPVIWADINTLPDWIQEKTN